MVYCRIPGDDWQDMYDRHAREEHAEARAAHRAEQRRDGADYVEPARAALLDAMRAYADRCRAEGRPPADLAGAVRAVLGDAMLADWYAARTKQEIGT